MISVWLRRFKIGRVLSFGGLHVWRDLGLFGFGLRLC